MASVRQLLDKLRARSIAREQIKLREWQDLMAWMREHGCHCYVCGCWHQFGDHR